VALATICCGNQSRIGWRGGRTGSTVGISLYMMGLALITLIATIFAHETVGKPIHE
jgi:hypothetical protein